MVGRAKKETILFLRISKKRRKQSGKNFQRRRNFCITPPKVYKSARDRYAKGKSGEALEANNKKFNQKIGDLEVCERRKFDQPLQQEEILDLETRASLLDELDDGQTTTEDL